MRCMNEEKNHRRSIRLHGYDYRDGGMYFVTICTKNRDRIFGEVRNGTMGLSEAGCIVADELQKTSIVRPYVTLDIWIIMPNHVHAIIRIHPSDCECCRGNENSSQNGRRGVARYAPTNDVTDKFANESNEDRFIGPPARSLGSIVRAFKSATTRSINLLRDAPGETIWQRNYHEHIIRDEDECLRIGQYIHDNPIHWVIDPDNI